MIRRILLLSLLVLCLLSLTACLVSLHWPFHFGLASPAARVSLLFDAHDGRCEFFSVITTASLRFDVVRKSPFAMLDDRFLTNPPPAGGQIINDAGRSEIGLTVRGASVCRRVDGQFGYAHIRMGQLADLRFLRVPGWCLILVFGWYPAMSLTLIHYRRHRRQRGNSCLNCGYSLTGNTSGVCPECGRPR